MSSKRWKTVEAHVLEAQQIEPQTGMTQVGDSLRFGPGGSISVAGRRYLLLCAYTVQEKTYTIRFSMVCDTVPSVLVLAYDPQDPAKWDWPEDRTLEKD